MRRRRRGPLSMPVSRASELVYLNDVTNERPAPYGRRWQASIGGALRDVLIDDRHGPLPVMLLALTVLGGVVDAVSIAALDHVFVAAMTGNLVFIGLGIAGIRGFSVASSAISLGAFLLGALAGVHLCRGSGNHRGRALRNVAAFKAILATPVTVIALLAGSDLGATVRTVITLLLAASMGSQLALIRYLKVPDLLTVVMTLTMTGVLAERGRRDPGMLRRGLALAAFAAGVIAGGVLVRFVTVGAALAFGLAIILAVLVSSLRLSRTTAPWAAPAGRPGPASPPVPAAPPGTPK